MYANGCISYGPIPHSYWYVTEGSAVHVSFLAFRLPPPPRLLATLVDPRRVYTCVANCRREGRASITRVTIFL